MRKLFKILTLLHQQLQKFFSNKRINDMLKPFLQDKNCNCRISFWRINHICSPPTTMIIGIESHIKMINPKVKHMLTSNPKFVYSE